MPGTRPGMTTSLQSVLTSLHQRTAAVRDRAERLIGRDGRNQPVVVVRVFRLVRLLDLEQIHWMDDAAVLPDRDIAEQFVLALEFFHLRDDVLRRVADGRR